MRVFFFFGFVGPGCRWLGYVPNVTDKIWVWSAALYARETGGRGSSLSHAYDEYLGEIWDRNAVLLLTPGKTD